MSFLRFDEADRAGAANPLGPDLVRHTLAMGVSQSGRHLRDFSTRASTRTWRGGSSSKA